LVKFGIMALAVPGIANLWLAVFGDVGVLFLAVLNGLRLCLVKKQKD
jgi:Cd2+/Zn2+-exporting ATPase